MSNSFEIMVDQMLSWGGPRQPVVPREVDADAFNPEEFDPDGELNLGPDPAD